MPSFQYKIIVSLFLAFLMTGCLGARATVPINYYLIDPIEYPNLSLKKDKPLSIEIISLHIPQYLERFHIAKRVSKSQLDVHRQKQKPCQGATRLSKEQQSSELPGRGETCTAKPRPVPREAINFCSRIVHTAPYCLTDNPHSHQPLFHFKFHFKYKTQMSLKTNKA